MSSTEPSGRSSNSSLPPSQHLSVSRQILDPVKSFIKRVPIVGPSLYRLHKKLNRVKSSSDYWERRYREGGNSGTGSYNRLADFKASFLNRFVQEHQIASVIEHGCGDGAQLKLATYSSYIGVDVSKTAVEKCRMLFAGDSSKRFLHTDSLEPNSIAELSLSLDVIFHLLEDSVFDSYMRRLFESASRFVIVYSSNVDWDRSGSHEHHRQFTRWVERTKPQWRLSSTVKNAYPYDEMNPDQTSVSDFYVFEPR